MTTSLISRKNTLLLFLYPSALARSRSALESLDGNDEAFSIFLHDLGAYRLSPGRFVILPAPAPLPESSQPEVTESATGTPHSEGSEDLDHKGGTTGL